MYQLIGNPKNRSFRVMWALEEMGLPYEVTGDGPRSEVAFAKNPTGKVPVLIDGDTVIPDSVAIMTYLADKHGKLTFPAGTPERGVQDSYTQFLCDEMDGALWTAARHSFILPEERRVPGIKESLRWEFTRSMKALGQRMGDNAFLMGERMTVPDLLMAHCGRWARNAKFEIGDTRVEAHIDRMMARPAYVRLMEAQAA